MVSVVLVLSVLACRTPAPGGDPCAAQPYAELAALCRVDVAVSAAAATSDAGVGGALAAVDAACDAQPDLRWAAECHYRAAEALGLAGQVQAGLEQCGRAAAYGQMCALHLAWVRNPGLEDFRFDAQQAARWPPATLPHVVAARELDRIYGTGVADPAWAQGVPPTQRAAAISAFALEAVRLLAQTQVVDGQVVDGQVVDGQVADAQLPQAVLAVWRGQRPLPRGAALPRDQRRLRLIGDGSPPSMQAQVTVPWFLTARRLTSPDPALDLQLATLEAIFALGADPGALNAAAASDEFLVRWTALRLLAADGQPTHGLARDQRGEALAAEVHEVFVWTATPR